MNQSMYCESTQINDINKTTVFKLTYHYSDIETEANSVKPDQSAPEGEFWSEFILFVIPAQPIKTPHQIYVQIF